MCVYMYWHLHGLKSGVSLAVMLSTALTHKQDNVCTPSVHDIAIYLLYYVHIYIYIYYM